MRVRCGHRTLWNVDQLKVMTSVCFVFDYLIFVVDIYCIFVKKKRSFYVAQSLAVVLKTVF